MKFGRLIFANLFRKKVRLLLTIGSFAVALFLFAFLAVVKDAFGRGSDVAGADRLIIINRVSIIQPLPLSYRDKILRIPGVKVITHNNWFGGVYQDEKNFFPQYVIDVENQRQVFPELIVPDDQWADFLKDRRGAVVGAGLAKRFGWKMGDHIPIKNSLFGGAATWDFNIDGIYHGKRPQDDETQFWFQWDYFEERMPQNYKGNVGWYILKAWKTRTTPRALPRQLTTCLPTLLMKPRRRRSPHLPPAGPRIREHRIPYPEHRCRSIFYPAPGYRKYYGHLCP